jgi:multiple sugar transport system permease protein
MSGKKVSLSRKLEPLLYIGPGLLVLGVIIIYPLMYSFYLSFHDWTINTFRQGVNFIGLKNYFDILSEGEFFETISVTLKFMAMAIPLEFFFGFLLALLLNQAIKGRRFIRAVVLLPMMCANIVIGLTWRLMYNFEFGIINYFLNILQINSIEWISDPKIALGSLVMVDVWNMTSFVAIMLLAGLQTIPREIYEAAEVDGVRAYQKILYITVPLLKRIFLVTLLWRIIDSFRIFDVPFLLTGGGPAGATQTISIYIYRYGFRSFMLSRASASSYLMVLLLLLIAGVILRFMKEKK